MGVIYRRKQIYGNNPLVETIGVGGGYAPIGTVISFMGTTAPQDYLICDGSTYNITDYTQLAAFFEAQFGSKNYFGGDGETTFAVPDLRGEFLRGTGTNSHTDQGSGGNVGAHQNATFIPYSYSYVNNGQTTGGQATRARSNANNEYNTPGNTDSYLLGENPAKYIYYQTSTVNASQTDRAYKYSTRPTNTSVLWCIKAIDGGEIYSTDERVVGTWINGKPIYQKTILTNTPDSSMISQLTPVVSVGANIETVVDYNAIVNYETVQVAQKCAPIVLTNGNNGGLKITIFNDTASANKNMIMMVLTAEGFSNLPIHITVKYTKISD